LRPAQANTLRDPIFKITRAKWTGNVTHVVEHSSGEALNSNPSTTKRKNDILWLESRVHEIISCVLKAKQVGNL
jgi:hypothetical protein